MGSSISGEFDLVELVEENRFFLPKSGDRIASIPNESRGFSGDEFELLVREACSSPVK